MAFLSAFSNMAKAYADPALRPRRRVALVAAFATVVGLAALSSVDIPESFARGGFFDDLFGGGIDYRPVESYHGYGDYGGGGHRRHASRHHGAHHRHARHPLSSHRFARAHHAHDRLAKADTGHAPATPAAPTAAPSGKRTVCVRACDGYFFQFTAADHGYDLATREAACASACPDAKTSVFVMPSGAEDMAQATEARRGELYSQYVARLKTPADAQKSGSCGCHIASAATPDAATAMKDPTLRKGDMVVTQKGVQIYQGGNETRRHGQFLSLAETHGLTPARRGALAAIERVLKFPRHHPQLH